MRFERRYRSRGSISRQKSRFLSGHFLVNALSRGRNEGKEVCSIGVREGLEREIDSARRRKRGSAVD